MPKNPLRFGRRKSSGILDDPYPAAEPAAAPAVSSFRVLERPEKINLNGDSRAPHDRLKQVHRPFSSPLLQLRGGSSEQLGSGLNRDSGGTTNSASSGYYESSSASARHSSSSTLPSSVDAERELEDEDLFPRKSKTTPMYQNVSADVDRAPRPSFTARTARAISFGTKFSRNGSAADIPAMPSRPTTKSGSKGAERSHSPPQRERATTTSSYASTAKPDLSLNLSPTDFGGDFGSMFDTPKKDSPLPPVPTIAGFHRTESEPIFPPRTHSRQAIKPEELRILRDDAGSPYSWDGRNSGDGLMTSSALSSPRLVDGGPPLLPAHTTGIAPAFLAKKNTGYSLVPDRYSPGPDRVSQDSQRGFLGEKYDGFEGSPSQSEDENPWARKVDLHSSNEPSPSAAARRPPPVTRKPLGMPSRASAGASRPGALSPDSSEGGGSLFASESTNTTPRAAKLDLPRHNDDSLFDSSPQGPPSRAIKPQHMRTESGTPKRMTKAQFERLKRGGDTSTEQSDHDEDAADEYDDEDDAERAKLVAQQRRKQEANMSVYRQQMKKVTGGGPSDLPSVARPSLDRAAASAPAATGSAIHLGGIGGLPPAESVRGRQTADEDDDDVPLGILQAHGFPSANRPPTRVGEPDAVSQRRTSVTGSVIGGAAGQGPLPPFARRLPADPYFGSSIVNHSNRESLGFGGTPSVYGGAPAMPQMMPQQPQAGHPGGLVGVIAGEERARAARRGSPNPATGTFGPASMPLPANMPQMGGMPGMPRTMSMGNVTAPSVYMPSGMGMMPQMPMMPQMQPQMPMSNAQQDQMQQFMQVQMQVMQNMLALQQAQMGQTPPPQQQPQQDYLGVQIPGNNHRVSTMSHAAPSVKSMAPASQGRAMTMMYPPTRWDVTGGAQRPNSAMPTAYAASGFNISNGGGPGPGYTPSIAPSERSNVGMPSRYRPVTSGGDGSGRTQSMTSSLTLQAFGNNRKTSPDVPPPASRQEPPSKRSTVRLIDKPKGTPKVTTKAFADEDEDEGWAEMKKKREDKKKFRFSRKGKDTTTESSLGDLYQNFD